MAELDFLSLRFEKMGEGEDDTYSVFLNEGEDGPEMIWYDSMGDPLVETGISRREFDDVKKLASDCGVAGWDGFSEMNVSEMTGFTLEAECADGGIIWAEGAGSFPEGFEEFEKGIKGLFASYLEIN